MAWDRVPEKERDKAVKLQKALASALSEGGEPGAATAQSDERRLAEFKAQFGYAVSARHWRRLFNRTMERDGGAENWQRLELYLDERAFAAPRPKRDAVRAEFEHRELD